VLQLLGLASVSLSSSYILHDTNEIVVTAGIPGTSQLISATVRFQQTQSTRMWVTYILL